MADIWLTLSISQNSQSIPNNTSNVTVVVYANWNYDYYNHNNKAGTLKIDGTSYSFSAPFNTSKKTNGGSEELFRKTVNVSHNSNGAKTLSVSAEYATGIIGTISKSASKTLTTIPRVSDLSVNKTSVPADGSTTVTATATKKSSSFTDTLTVTLGSYSKTITSGTAFTIPKEWNNAISGTSAKATVKVTTKSGSTTIGSKTVELTITVPASVVPVINDVSISEAVAAVTNAFGNLFVQNLSQLNVSINASGAYGSTIKSYSTALDGVNYNQQAFTSNVLKTSGTLNVKVKVTDSRNRTAEKTFTVSVLEYAKPTITSMVYMHCDSDGTQNSGGDCTKVTIAGVVCPVDEQNTKALKLKYKSMADEAYTERAVTLSDWTFSVDVIINNTDPTVTYEYVAELTDKINASTPETFRVTTGVPVLSRLAGGKGITLFGEAEEEGFVIKGDNPMKFISALAKAGTRQNINYIGVNPITSTDDDTTANWKALGTGIARFNTTGQLINQPSQYGIVLNMVTSDNQDARQIWFTMGGGDVYHRGGNANGWSHTWRKILDETKGTQIKKMWTNSKLTSAFSAQTISMSLSGYNAILAIGKAWSDDDTYNLVLIEVGKNAVLPVMSNLNATRRVTANTTGVTFAGGLYYSTYKGSATSNNEACIPVAIYGIKGVQ